MPPNRFADWKRRLPEFNNELKHSLGTNSVQLVATNRAPDLNLPKLIANFAKEFMQEGFVKEFVKPAFMIGSGLPDYTPYRDDAYKFMPHMEVAKSKEGSSYRHAMKRPSKLDRALARGDWKTVERIQAQDKKEGFDSYNTPVNENQSGPNPFADGSGDEHQYIGKWQQGFKKLLEALTTVSNASISGNTITVNMGSGRDLLSQRLGFYSVTRGPSSPSDFDSFFYAAEFGTGIGENVGGAQWIRHEVKGIQYEKVSYNGVYGHWWFGNKIGKHWYGGLFSGQRGLHFLYEPETRKPRPQFKQWITDNLQTELAKYLNSRIGGAIRLRGR
jgi:hypothetical protein